MPKKTRRVNTPTFDREPLFYMELNLTYKLEWELIEVLWCKFSAAFIGCV